MRITAKMRGPWFPLVIVAYLMGWQLGVQLRSSSWRRTICQSTIAVSLSQSPRAQPRESKPVTLVTVMIGVMTSWQNLTPAAAAILDTWGQKVTSQIVFYVGHAGNESADVLRRPGSDDTRVAPGSEPINIIDGVPVVELTDVDDVVSSPSHKSFAMLRHMHQNFGCHTRWFVRAADDVYIHYQNLTHFLLIQARFLQTLNSSQHPQGSFNSKNKASSVTPHSAEERQFMWDVHRAVQLSQLRHMQSRQQKLDEDLKEMDILAARHEESPDRPTAEGGRQSDRRSQNHEEMVSRGVDKGQRMVPSETDRKEGVHTDTEQRAGREASGEEEVWRRVAPHQQAERAIRHLSKASSQFRTRLAESFKHNLLLRLPPNEQFVRILLRLSVQMPHRLVTYQRRSVKHGLQYLVTVSSTKGFQSFMVQTLLAEAAWREDFHRREISVPSEDTHSYSACQRQHDQKTTVQPKLVQELGNNLIPSPPHTLRSPLPKLHFLIPLTGRHQKLLQFLENLDQVAESYGNDVHLYIALFKDSHKEHELNIKVSERKSVVSNNVFLLPGKFSRTKALNALAVLFEGSSIIVLMDVDMVLTDQFLYRVAFNVGPQTAYAPVVFSTYSPDTVCYGQPQCSPDPFDFSIDSGLWRDFGYGMMALRAEDYRTCGGMDNTIMGWGNEDVDFVNRCIKKGITILRARDPGLVHVYHDKVCDPQLPKAQLFPCHLSKWAMYGSAGRLAQMVMDLEKNGSLP